MPNHELRNAGYKMIQIAATTKCFSDARSRAAVNAYAAAVNAHDELNAVLVQLIALSVIENA